MIPEGDASDMDSGKEGNRVFLAQSAPAAMTLSKYSMSDLHVALIIAAIDKATARFPRLRVLSRMVALFILMVFYVACLT